MKLVHQFQFGTIYEEDALIELYYENEAVPLSTSGSLASLKFQILAAGDSDVFIDEVYYVTGDSEDSIFPDDAAVTISGVAGNVPMTGFNIVQSNLNMEIDDEVSLTTEFTPSYTTDSKIVTWTSSNNNVVTVSDTGLVKAISSGNAIITGTVNGFSDTVNVNVAELTIPITDFILTADKTDLDVGDNANNTAQLTVKKVPENATDELGNVTFKSSNTNVITVNSSGVVTAVGEGTAKITASRTGLTSKSITFNVTDSSVPTGDYTTMTITTVSNVEYIFLNSKTTLSSIKNNTNFPLIDYYSYNFTNVDGVNILDADYIGSKAKLEIKDSNQNILKTYTFIVPGDVSGNGQVKIYDAFQVLKGVLSSETLSGIDILIRDFNGDSQVKIYDAFQFLKEALM